MARDTLLDFFDDISDLPDVFIVHDDGYRTREVTYADVARHAHAFADRLRTAGVGAGDAVVVWSENRPEWMAALWGVLLAGAVLVPVDYRASSDLVHRISRIVSARVLLTGDEVDQAVAATAHVWPIRELGRAPAPTSPPAGRAPGAITGATLAEVIFTSGATGDPKGVTLTHRNILANLLPIEREIAKYRRYERPFHPLRFLNLLPQSHMFGQSMSAFIPPMIGGTVVFSHSYHPPEILRQIRDRRVSVLVCVPKVLGLLRDHLVRVAPDTVAPDPLAGRHWLWRWWHYRRVHRLFGWKFWCIVCGAAPLDPDLEAFWRKLGFLVVQGYGLTETAPIVTLNHPLRSSSGTVGAPIGGVEVRIADDGEVLVRGENVTGGYYGGTNATPDESPFEDGWFRTGDIGTLDEQGRLTIKGRKKEMIVTPQGLNVFPEDVERALLAQSEVDDAAVVGVQSDGEERVHAILVVSQGADVDAIVRRANATLEDHQRVRSTSVWPGSTLPRTEGTQKLRRRELQRWVSGQPAPAAGHGQTGVADVVGRFSGGRAVGPETTLAELGLSSLDRVELMMALENACQATLDESLLTGERTVAELETLVRPLSGAPADAAAAPQTAAEPIPFPTWNRSVPARLVRRVSLATWILPLSRPFVTLTVAGVSHLDAIAADEPVIFAANHQSHMDTPVVLRALPAAWRYRVAPAMAKEFFDAHFHPERATWWASVRRSVAYALACEFFNAFPLPQREAGTRQTLRYIGDLLADRQAILIFPEGRRLPDGDVGRFLPGIGMIASRLGATVVPVRLRGLETVLPPGARWPRRGPVRVAFGEPLRLGGGDYADLARQVEDAVRRL